MRELLGVMANEWMKLLRRRRFWVTGILALLTIGLFSVVTYHDHRNQGNYDPVVQTQNAITMTNQQITSVNQQPKSAQRDAELQGLQQQLSQMQSQLASLKEAKTGDWHDSVKTQIAAVDSQISNLQSGLQSADARQQIGHMQMQEKTLQYSLDHNIEPPANGQDISAYNYMTQFNDIAAHIFLPLLVVILIADMVSGEATDGTIKLLLVRPVSRIKILLGKWIISLIGAVIITVVFFAALWAAATLIAGTQGGLQPILTDVRYTFETVLMPGNTRPSVFSIPHLDHAVAITQWNFFVTGVLYTALAMMAVATIAFFCSTLFKSAMASSAIAMGTVVIGFIVGNMAQHQSWIGWIFATHLDLWQNWTGNLAEQTQQNLTLATGLWVLGAWAVVTLAVSLWRFSRRDVLNA